MAFFGAFEAHPFLVNAFTKSNISVALVKLREIKELIEGRKQKIEYEQERGILIPTSGGNAYKVTVADMTGSEELLCDPNRRPREELLRPAEHPLPGIDGVADFLDQHKLTPRRAESLLQFAPLDATHLLASGLPEVELPGLAAVSAPPPVPTLPRAPFSPAALLVKARDRRG